MGLDKLRNEIRERTGRQVKAEEGKAAEERTEILAQARKEAKKLIETERVKSEEEAKGARVEVSAARLKAHRMAAEAREEVVREVIAEMRNELEELAGSKAYEKTFEKLVKEGAKEVGEEFVLHVRPHDRELAKKYGPVGKEPITTIGGVIVSTKDGRVQANNTFEALLEEHEEEIKREVFAKLFGKER
ncbi:MAG: V-type ATP synthase subunit E [Candidatus Micrarchaeota archaeon]